MSSRALRKLQKEQELQKQLAAAKEAEEEVEEEDEEDESEPVVAPSIPKNTFDMLEDEEEGESEAEPEDEDAPQTSAHASPPTPQAPSIAKSTKAKRKKKKIKKKSKDTPAASTPATGPSRQESEDEVDRALKELSLKKKAGKDAEENEAATASWEISATKQLAIEPKNLNPTNEMRSLFGNVALEGEARPAQRNQPQRRREQNQQGGVDLATALTGRYCRASQYKELGNLAHRRNVFTQGKEDWPLASSGGISMDFSQDPSSFERHYNIVHSNAYQDSQRNFRMVVESMDPQRMIALLGQAPYHIATLLQVSEIAKHQGDHSVSGDLLERALFSLGRSVHSTFPKSLREGTARISFDKSSNRELYLTIWRYIRNLEQRGTWKTAFEWAKLLLQLNTLSDPYGVTLMIDQLALRGRSHEQLLKLASDEAYGTAWRHLPNVQISLVLAYLRSKQGREARKQLALCIQYYPYIISAVASSLDISPLPKALWAKLPSTDVEKLYTELYVSRAKDLWNTPETSALIVEVADTMQYYSSTISASPPAPKLEISLEEARHIMLLETPHLIALLPRRFTMMPTSSSDVLPPPNSTEDSDFTARAPTDGSGISIMQNIMNAGASTAGTALMRSFERFREWITTPVGPNTNPDEGQAALANLTNDLMQQGMDPDMIAELIQNSLPEGVVPDAEDDEEITLEGLGMANGMVGGWDYYADAADDNTSENVSDDEESMPALEEIPTQDTRPAAAPTPPQQPQPDHRNPRAAMVEEDDDEELPGTRNRAELGNAVLRRIDSNDEAAATTAAGAQPVDHHAEIMGEIWAQPRPRLRSPGRLPSGAQMRPQTQPQMTSEADSSAALENDPQRLQRWLLTTGFQDLQPQDSTNTSHDKMSLYMRRMKILRKTQQDWILNMIAQRTSGGTDLKEKDQGKELVERIRRGVEFDS